MIPQRFANSNIVMKAPRDMPDCSNIHALYTIGAAMPPVCVTADYPFTETAVVELI